MISEKNIGIMAGKVWKKLRQEKQLPISQIPKAVKGKDTIVYLALGWLAREGKLDLSPKGNKTLVSLSK